MAERAIRNRPILVRFQSEAPPPTKHQKGVDCIVFKRTFVLLLALVLLACPVQASAEYALTTVSQFSAEQLKPFMHPETQHLAKQVVDICAETGISAEFIIAVMRLERNPDIHNYFGWSWGDGSLVVFDTDEECLKHCIPLIKQKYLTEDGDCFNGYTVADVSIRYNNNDFWREFIVAEMDVIFEKAIWFPTPPPNQEIKIQMYQQFLHSQFN